MRRAKSPYPQGAGSVSLKLGAPGHSAAGEVAMSYFTDGKLFRAELEFIPSSDLKARKTKMRRTAHLCENYPGAVSYWQLYPESKANKKAPYDDGSISTVNQQRKDGLSCLNVKARHLLWGTTRQSLWYHSRKEFLKQKYVLTLLNIWLY